MATSAVARELDGCGRNTLKNKKKGPEPKLEALSPDGYSGGKGGAARLN
jgi:hypothetical protein